MGTLKSFAQLHDDYAFFERHVSETQAGITAWLPLVQERWGAVRALDFGAGSGSFTTKFLEQAGFDRELLQLTLVEPDPTFRRQAKTALSAFCSAPVQAWPLLDRDLAPSFELIFSHHVLYYVPDVAQTLERLCRALVPGGRLLISQGGKGNGLNQLVWAAFAELSADPPYNYSEQTQAILQQSVGSGLTLRVEKVHSQLDFQDSEEARWKILRFLLSEHLARLPQDVALALFEPFRRGDRITIESWDELFVVDAL